MARLLRATGVRGYWPGMPHERPRRRPPPAVWDAHHRMQAEWRRPVARHRRSSPWPRSSASSAPSCSSGCRRGTSGSTARPRTSCDRWPTRRGGPGPDRLGQPHPLLALAYSTGRDEMILTHSETGAGPLDMSPRRLRRAARPAHLRRPGRVGARQRRRFAHGRHSPSSLDEADIVRAILEPRTLPNINDSGAHQQLFAAAGEHVYLLTHYVRDTGLLTIEQGVHALTGRAAEFFGLADRGVDRSREGGRPRRVRPRRDRARRRAATVGRAPRHLAAGAHARPASAPPSPPASPRGSTAPPPTLARAALLRARRLADGPTPDGDPAARWPCRRRADGSAARCPWVAFGP